ncbi:MAG: GTPase HflX [Planctomycetota bacterium]
MEKLRETLRVKKERAVLVGAVLAGGKKKNDGLCELAALVESAGAVIVDRFQQKIRTIHSATYIGSGKVDMLRDRVRHSGADVVIFNNDLSPGQIRAIEKCVQAKVLDRSELILDIFATRARTHQAKLQVELAQLEYTYPRLTRMWSHLDTLAAAGGAGKAGAVGAIGTRGTGEKQLEIDRRLVKKRIAELKRELRNIDRRRLREIEGRRDYFKVCIVGYTNAGKSTLLNALTDAGAIVEDRLFATLDTRTRRWAIERGVEVLLSDTVGFLQNLPHHLVASFKATLEEVVNADLLLHVVDVSNEDAPEQLLAVNKVLQELGCGDKPDIVVLNKSDVLWDRTVLEMLQTLFPQAICISAKNRMNLDELASAVLARVRGNEITVRVESRQSNGRVQSFLRSSGRIINEDYRDNLAIVMARLGRNQLGRLRQLRPDKLEVVDSIR